MDRYHPNKQGRKPAIKQAILVLFFFASQNILLSCSSTKTKKKIQKDTYTEKEPAISNTNEPIPSLQSLDEFSPEILSEDFPKAKYTCPNGWRQEREFPYYSIEQHDQLFLDLPKLDGKTVLIELIFSLNFRCQYQEVRTFCNHEFKRSMFTLEPSLTRHGFSVVNFLMTDRNIYEPSPPIKDCFLYEKYEDEHPLIRLLMRLSVTPSTNSVGETELRVDATVL